MGKMTVNGALVFSKEISTFFSFPSLQIIGNDDIINIEI